MKAYKHLVKYALAAGNVVSVYDEEEWAVKRSSKYQQIIDAIESVDMAQIVIRDKEGNKLAWAQIVLEYNQEDEESVSDYSDNDYMAAWDKEYYKK